jgi:intracellular multiplication protein IcmQ
MPSDNEDRKQNTKLIGLIQEAIQRDNSLREKHQIGDKFKFVRDRLQAFLEQLEKEVQLVTPAEKVAQGLGEDEELVYVYLYNANGLVFKSWQNMLLPGALNEYSVNRPIYSLRDSIDSLLRTKTNKVQHAFLTVAIKKTDILRGGANDVLQDAFGNKLLKIKESSLRFEKIIVFTHNAHEYELGSNGELTKKE